MAQGSMSESRSTSPGTPIPRRPWRAACLTVVMLTTGCATDRDVTNGTVEVTGSGLIGIAAPSFDLSDHDSQRVSLGDYRGQWVVMYFYPEDDTPGCTIQATEFSAKLPELREIDAVVLGISPDSVVEHRFFRARHDLEIRLLSDPDYRVMTLYGARREITWRGRNIGRVIRSTVLISPDGRIAWHWPEVVPEGHADRVEKKLHELRREYARAATTF